MKYGMRNIVSNRRKPVEFYSDDLELIEDVKKRLDALAIYDVKIYPPEAFSELRPNENSASAIILDVDNASVFLDDRSTAVAKTRSNTPTIVVARDLNPDKMRSVLKLQASDLLYKPVSGNEIVNAVAMATELNLARNSKIRTFISANGGAGASTLSLAVVEQLAAKYSEDGTECCLVDLDFQTASCSVYLNQACEYDLSGIIENPSRLDVEILDAMKINGPSNFALYAFEQPQLPFSKDGPEFVLKLLDLLAFRYNDIVIDLPNLDTPWQNSVLTASDTIYIVFEINLASIHKAKKLLRRMREYNNTEIILVANKNNNKWFGNHISIRDLKKLFKELSINSINYEPDLLNEAINRGLAPSQVKSNTRFQKDVKSLVEGRSNA